MGLFPQCVVFRFVDHLAAADVATAAEVLCKELFSASSFESIQLESETFPADEAAAALARKIAGLNLQAGLSGGMQFAADKNRNPQSCWNLWIHQGPLPLLQLETFQGTGFFPSYDWHRSLLSSSAAHGVWLDGKGYFGFAHQIYLLKKRPRIFPYSKGSATQTAVAGGLRLRAMCQSVTAARPEYDTQVFHLSNWRWRQKRFLRQFDRLLLAKGSSENLEKLFKEMGASLASWLEP